MNGLERRVVVVVAAALLMGPVTSACAADEEPKEDAPKAEKPKVSPVEVTASSDGFAIKSESGDFKLELKGLVQFDGRFFLSDSDNALTNNLLIRRARPIFQGTVAKYFEFNLTPDFAAGTTVIQYAFLTAKTSPRFAVKIGKYKPPIGIERLQADASTAFVERALPASLESNRDVGVQIQGELAKGAFSYAAGIFDGTPDGASVDFDVNDGKALVGRLFLYPFKTGRAPLKGLGFGISGSTENQSGPAATVAGYRTGGQNTFFSYATGVAPSGTRTRVSPELAFFSGPLGILAEYVRSKGELLKTTTTTATATTPATTTTSGPFAFDNHAWQATLSVSLTGDESSFEGVKIKKPFDPAKGRWGALQLAARVNGFEASPESFAKGFADINKSARKASAWGVGLNWYLNKNVKQVVSFERTTFTGGAAKGADRTPESALLIRSELKF